MMHGTGEGSTLEGSGTPSLLTAVWTYSWAVVIKYVIPPVLLLLLVKGIQVRVRVRYLFLFLFFFFFFLSKGFRLLWAGPIALILSVALTVTLIGGKCRGTVRRLPR